MKGTFISIYVGTEGDYRVIGEQPVATLGIGFQRIQEQGSLGFLGRWQLGDNQKGQTLPSQNPEPSISTGWTFEEALLHL